MHQTTQRDSASVPTIAPVAGSPENKTKAAVAGVEGYDAQAALLKPAGPADDPLTRWARALNAAKTETEKQSVLLQAESKGLARAEVEAKAAELLKEGVAPEGGAASEGAGAVEPGGGEAAKEEAKGEEAAGEEKEETDPVKARAALETKLAAATTTRERQAIYDTARAKGVELGGSATSKDGATTGVTLAGETEAKAPEEGGPASRQARGTVGVTGDSATASGNLARDTSQFEGLRTTTQVGAGGTVHKDGSYQVSGGARQTETYDSSAPSKDSLKTSKATYGGVTYDSKEGLSGVVGRQTEEARQDGAFKTVDKSSAELSAGGGQVGWKGAQATTVSEEIELTAAEKAAAEKEAAEKKKVADEARAKEIAEAKAAGTEPPLAAEEEEKDAPTNSVTSGATAELSLGGKGIVAAVGAQETKETAERLDTPGEKDTRKAGIGYSSTAGFSANASQEKVVSVEGAAERKDSRSLALTGGNAVGTLGQEETYKGADGSESTSKSAATVGIGKDGLTTGYSGGTVDKAADGSSRETTGGVNANLSEGKIGGTIGTAKKDADGKVVSGMSAAGEMDFNAQGELEGASGQVAATKGPVDIVIAGQYKYTIAEPKLVKGLWLVTYTKSVGGNATLGAQSAAGYSGSLGGNASETSNGERSFKTKAEADAFREKGPDEAAAPTTAAAVGKLAVGDRVSTTDAKGGQIGGGAMIEGIQIGAKLQLGQSHTVTVVKADANKVQVEVTDADTLGGEASLGTFGVSMKAGASRTLSEGIVLEFDISNPAGQAAFEQFRASGVVPATGARLVAKTTGRSDSEVSGMGLGIIDVTDTSTVDQSTTQTAEGDKIEKAAGTDTVGVDAGFLGKHKVATTLDTRETNDAARTYGTKATIDSSSVESASHELAAATGVKENHPVAGTPKGQWSVTSHFSEAQIQKLCDEINSDDFNYSALIYQSDDGLALVQAVKGSGGDMDAVRLALSEFISETGARGLALMRDTIGGKFAYDLQLAGDKYFTGAAGREATERRVADFKARLASPASDKGTLVGEIATCLTGQQEKLAAIGDPKQYPELPSQLRGQEMAKTQAIIETLEQQRDQALAGLQGSAAAPTSTAAKPAVGGATPATADNAQGAAVKAPVKDAPIIGPETPAQAAAREWAVVVTAEAKMKAVRGEASSWRERARTSRWVQVGGAYAFMHSAFYDFGARGYFSDGELAGDFEGADASYKLAESAWNTAEVGLREFDKLKTDAAVGMAKDPAAWVGKLESALTAAIVKIASNYRLAKRHYAATEIWYQQIKASILAKDPGNVNCYFLGYDNQMPEGANVP